MWRLCSLCAESLSWLPCHPAAGNLARFINHSCEPNLVLNPVLRPGDSGMRYCVAIFAGR